MMVMIMMMKDVRLVSKLEGETVKLIFPSTIQAVQNRDC